MESVIRTRERTYERSMGDSCTTREGRRREERENETANVREKRYEY